MYRAFAAEQTVEKSVVTKQGAFSCAFGMVKKDVTRTVRLTCWVQHRIFTTKYGEPSFHWWMYTCGDLWHEDRCRPSP